eukprot:m.333 g.333  ORF g.333 m.333 type:complete len:97 (+) comp1734_c0_seq2:654-944(+)
MHLDISYICFDSISAQDVVFILPLCLRSIFFHTPSLTHLEISCMTLSKVAEELKISGRLAQLRFLAYFNEDRDDDVSVPFELEIFENLWLAVKSAS